MARSRRPRRSRASVSSMRNTSSDSTGSFWTGGRVGFPLWSGGFCKEPKHPRRMEWHRKYKAQAVQRVIESGRPLADIAAELDMSPGQLSQWRNEQLAAGSAEALAQKKADEAEMLRLKREVKRLEDENLILRKAAAFFAKGIA